MKQPLVNWAAKILTQRAAPDVVRVGHTWAIGLCIALCCFLGGVGYVALDYYRTFIVPETPQLPPSVVSQYRQEKIQAAADAYVQRARIFRERRYNERVAVPVAPTLTETTEENAEDDALTVPPQVPSQQDSSVLAE